MAKNKISDYSATPANNTDINNIDIAEGCSPSGINNAIRELMADLKDWQAGSETGQALAVASGGTGGENATDARTNLSAAKSGANSDITSLSGLTTPITVAQGGTGFVAQRTITTVGRATNVVTIATSAAHNYVVNDNITVAAVTNTSVNGSFTIASVPTSTTFTYAQTGTDYANTTDTGTVTSSSYLVADNISGIVAVKHGGTGANTLKANNLLVGNGTSAPSVIPAGTTGNVLTSSGTSTVTAGSFAVGTEYTIATVGTTSFTSIGAASNTVGIVFTATGVGTGDGTATTNTWVSSTPAGGIGVNQTWQDVTSSRAMGTTYTNNTGRPIMLVARASRSAVSSAGIGITISGVYVPVCYGTNSNGGNESVGSIIIPTGATYVLSVISESLSNYSIYELR